MSESVVLNALVRPRPRVSVRAWRVRLQASTPLRTPWGDPDLQGNYTNLWELGTPLERPDQFAGRRLEDIKGAELLRIRLAIQEQMRTEALAGDTGTPWIWLDSHNHAKGSTAWFVVDPRDGKIPPLTPDGARA
jgi:hypothetical protein